LTYTGADTSTGNKKCEICAKTVILDTVCAYITLKCYKNSRELPDDGVDKRRKASELKSDQLTKKVCIKC